MSPVSPTPYKVILVKSIGPSIKTANFLPSLSIRLTGSITTFTFCPLFLTKVMSLLMDCDSSFNLISVISSFALRIAKRKTNSVFYIYNYLLIINQIKLISNSSKVYGLLLPFILLLLPWLSSCKGKLKPLIEK